MHPIKHMQQRNVRPSAGGFGLRSFRFLGSRGDLSQTREMVVMQAAAEAEDGMTRLLMKARGLGQMLR
jgi:hypothetical protein